jgi:hypothetical protein
MQEKVGLAVYARHAAEYTLQLMPVPISKPRLMSDLAQIELIEDRK